MANQDRHNYRGCCRAWRRWCAEVERTACLVDNELMTRYEADKACQARWTWFTCYPAHIQNAVMLSNTPNRPTSSWPFWMRKALVPVANPRTRKVWRYAPRAVAEVLNQSLNSPQAGLLLDALTDYMGA